MARDCELRSTGQAQIAVVMSIWLGGFGLSLGMVRMRSTAVFSIPVNPLVFGILVVGSGVRRIGIPGATQPGGVGLPRMEAPVPTPLSGNCCELVYLHLFSHIEDDEDDDNEDDADD